MKINFIITCALCFLLYSCSRGDEKSTLPITDDYEKSTLPVTDDDEILTFSISDDDEILTLSVSDEKIVFTPEGGEMEITVTTNADWKVYYGWYWLDVDTTRKTGNGSFRIKAQPNITTAERINDIIVETLPRGGLYHFINIIQEAGSGMNWMNNIVELSKHNEKKISITEGIWGTVILREGNCMPGVVGRCFYYPVKREVLVYEYTKLNETVQLSTSPFYSEVFTKLIATTISDEEGFFEIGLAPGKYSVFVKEKLYLYSNLFDGSGGINPAIVETSVVTNHNMWINYASD